MATKRATSKKAEPELNAAGMSIAVISSIYNPDITSRLMTGASSWLLRCGIDEQQLVIDQVPGAWEIPLAAQRIAQSGKVDAIICLGAVIRGETSHFDIIASESAQGIARVMLDYSIPVANGILAVDTEEQALERAGGKLGNKGEEAAQTALTMVYVLRNIDRKYGSSRGRGRMAQAGAKGRVRAKTAKRKA